MGPTCTHAYGCEKGSKMNINLRQRLLATTLLVGASALATPAFAQDQNVDPAQAPPTGAVEAQPTPDVSSQGETVEQRRVFEAADFAGIASDETIAKEQAWRVATQQPIRN